MKKISAFALALTFLIGMAGCANKPDNTTDIAAKSNSDETEISDKWDLVPMVMIDGALYLATGYESTAEERYDAFDGEITSEVDGSKKPTINDQSNFGTGYGYQYGKAECTIEIYMNNKWLIFATEEVRKEIQFPEKNDNSGSERPGAQRFIVDIIDRTKTEGFSSDTALEKFFEDENNEYRFNVIKSHHILVIYNNGNSEDIKSALESGRATIADLDKFGIEYLTEPKSK